MKKTQIFLVLLCTTVWNATAQSMLKTSEWCSHFNTSFAPPSNTLDGRSDSIDIVHTLLHLNITDLANKNISGSATLDFSPKLPNVDELRLDLLSLMVDSVKVEGIAFNWAYNSKHLQIDFSTPLVQGENYQIHIFYRGKPIVDASNWGGFYFQGSYAYNLGVGFQADPHNFGRIWFPCFDNFTERSLFTMHITTASDKPAFCNGLLQSDEMLPNNLRKRVWAITDPIPSYLACVALGPYTAYERTLSGELGDIPVQIAVAPADTNKLKSSFLHLPEAVAAFEHWYGPYRWQKVGYSVVPFSSGAMEHATNIAYMRPAVDGTLSFETLMAHELSHHWWGDLATCSTAEDMWLNEGWASYSEHLFLEWVYGYNRYITTVEANFLDVLENTHVSEGGYRAVSGIPHDITYGSHVYNKGAVVAHNLRAYLGDTLFRTGLRAVMDQTQMEDFSSAELRDKLSAATGVNLDDFFENWVFSPGFTDFTIDSTQFSTLPNGNISAQVWVKQRLRGTEQYYNSLPLELSFLRTGTTPLYRTGLVGGAQTALQFEFPADAQLNGNVWVNTRSKITQARAVAQKNIPNNVLSVSFAPAKMEIKVTDPIVDSIKLRVEYHYSMPDTAGLALPEGYTLTNRFWVVDGEIHDNANGLMVFTYDGRQQLDQLDRLLFLATGPKEDSVRLLYRPHAGMAWQEHPAYIKNLLGNNNDRWGQLRASLVLRGEYTIGKGPSTVGINDPNIAPISLKLYPNPAKTTVTIETDTPIQSVQVYDVQGRLVLEQNGVGTAMLHLNTQALVQGHYQVLVMNENGHWGLVDMLVAP